MNKIITGQAHQKCFCNDKDNKNNLYIKHLSGSRTVKYEADSFEKWQERCHLGILEPDYWGTK